MFDNSNIDLCTMKDDEYRNYIFQQFKDSETAEGDFANDKYSEIRNRAWNYFNPEIVLDIDTQVLIDQCSHGMADEILQVCSMNNITLTPFELDFLMRKVCDYAAIQYCHRLSDQGCNSSSEIDAIKKAIFARVRSRQELDGPITLELFVVWLHCKHILDGIPGSDVNCGMAVRSKF